MDLFSRENEAEWISVVDSSHFEYFKWINETEKEKRIALQRLPITRDLRHSKELDEVAFWWTSIKEKWLKLFSILTRF